MTHAQWRENFAHTLGRWQISYFDAREIMRLAQRIQTLAVVDCNVGMTPRQVDTRRRTLERLVVLASSCGLHVAVQGDPRGACVRVARMADCATPDDAVTIGTSVPARG